MCKKNFGRESGDPFTYDDLINAIDPEDQERMRTAVRESIAKHAPYDIEYRIRTPAGEKHWVHVRGQTSYAADGTALSMAGVSLDITERKTGEEHRAMLVGELNHRVKNSMANIQAIVNQPLRYASSIEEAHTTLNARLGSLARAHDVFMHENWVAVSKSSIVTEALAPFQTAGNVRFKIDGPDVRLTARLALSFTLALHELATNAIKYGALSNDKGRIFLNCCRPWRQGRD